MATIHLSQQDTDTTYTTWLDEKESQITKSASWHGLITGTKAESILENQKPLSYIVRGDIEKYHYYLSFVDHDLSIKHQPINLTASNEGWLYRNGVSRYRPTFIELVPLVLHTELENCIPICAQH